MKMDVWMDFLTDFWTDVASASHPKKQEGFWTTEVWPRDRRQKPFLLHKISFHFSFCLSAVWAGLSMQRRWMMHLRHPAARGSQQTSHSGKHEAVDDGQCQVEGHTQQHPRERGTPRLCVSHPDSQLDPHHRSRYPS